ncbi:MAG: GGDEF domain-containing protein, partial [Gammaproteobacteria bacterium]|nr:GGDEF domain-containing protein [Gammaproteobacteria bacterium]
TDIRRLSRLNETLREITQTMLLYRDFRDIAERLFEVVARSLPVERIDYYAKLDDGAILTLSHETRYSGFTVDPLPEVAAILGKTRAQWLAAYRGDLSLTDHVLYDDLFGTRTEGSSALVVTLPLFSPQADVMQAVALIRVGASAQIGPEETRVIEQIMMPLQVALEREVIYRSIETERQKAYQRSIRDSLTGLFTRFYMQEMMEHHCSVHDRDESSPVAAVMVDVDHFKRVNDTHGHAAGDEVLKQVAQILRKSIRETDIPVRFGGEEFVLFLVGSSALGARDCAERIRSAIEQHAFAIDADQQLAVTVSLGAAMRSRFESLDALIRRADRALYRAKRNGRNRLELDES